MTQDNEKKSARNEQNNKEETEKTKVTKRTTTYGFRNDDKEWGIVSDEVVRVDSDGDSVVYREG